MNRESEISRIARETGLDAVRYARWDAVLDQSSRLERWLANGYAGDMEYLQRRPGDRCNPRSLLAECNSVIVCALGYHIPDSGRDGENHPLVSRYAWGDDYHEVLKDKLKLLGNRIGAEIAEHSWKATVDTSPVLEKAFGEASGIGWRGKHTLIINPELGSWFFIGLLLTSLELIADDTLPDGCETCKACLDACPTSALAAPRVLSANKCISYLTTEVKEPPPAGTDLHGWLYGCDLCQLACPYNSDLPTATEPRFTPARGIEQLTVNDVIAMDETEFDARFAGTVIKRRKLWRLKSQAQRLVESDATLGG